MVSWTNGSQVGPYTLVERIGAGGMGEVWKAQDARLRRTVAIKRLSERHSARFEQEARAIAALNHPHICTLHDIGPDYLVMEYVEGSPVAGPLPPEEALRLALQIASALETAHAKGIIHRDLKPGNILCNAAGAKLLDFGLAKLTASPGDATLTLEGTIAGTAGYMSPEQARGEPLDARSDIFSFGAVFYELLAGRRAFSGGSTTEILSALLRDEPRPLDSPLELRTVVRRCLRKTREGRYGSMAEVRAALERVKLAGAEQPPSIAVLPFANMSRDADDEYFSDGLAEEIINLLAHVPDLKVTARTSAFAFRGKEQDITKIAEVLRVQTVLEGSVRRAGNRIRVTAQLINAADGYHLWSERYDRELTDVFAIQDEIAAAIAGALKLKLTPPAAERHTPNLAAYEAYLKYRHYQWSFTHEASQRSREYLEQALALDPQFALPYVGLADYHLALASVGGIPAREAMPRARELAGRALELDPDLPEAHAMLGIVAGHYDFDWKEAGRRFELAMAREPVSCHLRQWYALFYLFSVGRTEEARRQMEQVLEEDPLCQMWHYVLSGVLLGLGLADEALAQIRKACELDSEFWLGQTTLGWWLGRRGQHEEALEWIEKGAAAAPWSPYSIGLLAGALDHTGEREKAAALLAKLEGGVVGAPVGHSVYHLFRGEIDSAVEWAGRAVEQRFPSIATIVIGPFAPQLRHSAGWPGLLAKMNLAEHSPST